MKKVLCVVLISVSFPDWPRDNRHICGAMGHYFWSRPISVPYLDSRLDVSTTKKEKEGGRWGRRRREKKMSLSSSFLTLRCLCNGLLKILRRRLPGNLPLFDTRERREGDGIHRRGCHWLKGDTKIEGDRRGLELEVVVVEKDIREVGPNPLPITERQHRLQTHRGKTSKEKIENVVDILVEGYKLRKTIFIDLTVNKKE